MLITLRFVVLIFALASITIAGQMTLGVTLSPAQKRAFVAAVLQAPQQQMEDQLPRKLASLHRFKPYFEMHELATTAYGLVIESPHDMSRWRALAKIAAYADGEYFLPYESARREALAQNPRLFDSCPQFQRWIKRRTAKASNQSMKPTAPMRGETSELATDPARGLSPSR